MLRVQAEEARKKNMPRISEDGDWYLGDYNTGVHAQGEHGADGEDGKDGTTFTPSVSDEGILSWTNDGQKENPSPVNIMGPQGRPGKDGGVGPAGKDGTAGSDGTTFTPHVTPDGTISWTNDGQKENPDPVNFLKAVIVPIAKGGTGAGTAAAAVHNLADPLAAETTLADDDTMIFNDQSVGEGKKITVANMKKVFVGDYNDLLNKPAAVLYTSQYLTTTQKRQARTNLGAGTSDFSGNYSDLTGKPDFAEVATSGDYNDLLNKPSIPTSYAWGDITEKPSWVNSSSKPSYSWKDITGKPDVATTSDLNGYVSNAGAETIGGAKTFSLPVRVGEFSADKGQTTISGKSIQLGAAPNETAAIFTSSGIAFLKYGASGSSAGNALSFPTTSGTFALLEDLLDKVYPIGSVYISYNSTSPASRFGGSWTAITGRFPYFNAGTSTGGSNTHTLTIDELPKHTHDINEPYTTGSGNTTYGSGIPPHNNTSSSGRWIPTVQSVGGGKAFNIMPAYQTLYAWRRTA